MEKIYVANIKKPSIEIKRTMDDCSTGIIGITAALFGLYILCAIIFATYPLLVFAFFTMKEPILPVFIPFVDWNTKEGFIITSIYHLLLLYMAGVGIGFVDALFANLVFNVLTMSELQSNQLAKLNEELTKRKCHALTVQMCLVNMFKMNQEMEK